MHWKRWSCAAASLSLMSCAQIGEIVGVTPKSPVKDAYGLGAYQQAGGRVSGMDASMVNVTGGSRLGAASAVTGITREEDIVWASENPDEPMGGGLEELWKRPENKSWQTSHTEARRQSHQSGKPMMIWFTDSMHSPLCRKLSDELFSKLEFEQWASGRLVRLRVDTALPAKERDQNLRARKRQFIENLKKRYSIHGHPTVLILSPRGAAVASYRGYKKGTDDYYWARIKQAVIKAEEDYGSWREKLERRGYRLWTSRGGRKTFAKLYRYRPESITLIDPEGKRGSTSFRKLSDADQAWLLLQKKKYDARQER
ncbi:MAG: thioredoxin family protein [Akkermansiaceae bacterium]|nr:thioredoxin family protein [Akkermansiaceae bacterium]